MLRSENVRSLLVRTVCASLPVAIALPLASQQVGDWRLVEVASPAAARTGFALVELPGGTFAQGRLLMIGGGSANPAIRDRYWNGISWNLLPPTPFQRRDEPAIARFGTYGLLLYGGSANGQLQSDTWVSSTGFQWSQPTTGSPGVLSEATMAYDPQSDRCVLVGQGTSGLFETWFIDSSFVWSAGPTMAVADARVVTDSVRREVLLFADEQSNVRVDTLVDDDWVHLADTPIGVRLGEIAFDRRRARVVLTQPTDTRDTWEWDGLSFRSLAAPTGSFVPPVTTGLGYDGVREETLLVTSNGTEMEIRRHVAEAGPQVEPFGSSCAGSDAVELVAGIPQPGQSHQLGLVTSLPQGTPFAAFSVLGNSRVSYNGVPLPIPVATCQLFVAPVAVNFIGNTLPVSQLVTLPANPSLAGERYQVQMALLLANGLVRTSRSLEIQIGNPLPEQVLEETFANAQNRDAAASSQNWGFGQVVPGLLGGDGRHGSFDATIGVELEPGLYEWNTDNMVIPATHTLTGVEETVTDGRFQFTDLHVPAGVTVQFVGSHPVHLFVRGEATIDGTLSVDAPDGPGVVSQSATSAGQFVSTFNARQAVALAPGQPGGLGGPGGGRGGNGGDECQNTGPTIVNGVDVTSGQPGESVALFAGHAYASQAVDTGGAGGELMPATGVLPFPVPLVGNVFTGFFSSGGAGGGFEQPGQSPLPPSHVSSQWTVTSGPLAVGGQSFSPLPVPSGASSLEHFSIGGSGGGGGGSHGYGLIGISPTLVEKWMAGHAGTGGGGVLVVRSGGRAFISGSLTARGGDGALIDGNDPALANPNGQFGISSPGGGGSGGTVLVQSATVANLANSGVIDTRGGFGCGVGSIASPLLNMIGAGGDGANGYFRLEALQATGVQGPTVPTFQAALHTGVLSDRDELSGSRSLWRLAPSGDLPVYLRYELLVRINGLPVLFSDDPAVSPVAADDLLAGVQVRFQGARVDPLSGQVESGTEGPWRSYLRAGDDSLNSDRAQAVRFDLVLDSSVAQIEVLNLRIVWE